MLAPLIGMACHRGSSLAARGVPGGARMLHGGLALLTCANTSVMASDASASPAPSTRSSCSSLTCRATIHGNDETRRCSGALGPT